MSYQQLTTTEIASGASAFFKPMLPGNEALKAQKRISNAAVDFARAGKLEQAIAALEAGLETHPDNIFFIGQLGHLYRRAGDFTAARDCMEHGHRLRPTDIKTLSSLGSVYAALGDFPQAELVLRQASELDPDDMFVVVALSNILIQQNKLHQAADVLSESGGVDRGNKYIIATYGIVLSMQDRTMEARDLLEQGYALHSRDPYIINLLGMVCGEMGDYHAAEDVLSRAVRIDPRNKFIAATLGNVLLRQRKLGEAERALTVALRSNPRDLVLLNLLGNVFLQQGDMERAQTVLGDALRIAPGNIAAVTTLGHLYLRQKNYIAFDRLTASSHADDDESFLYLKAKGAFLQNRLEAARSFCEALFALRGYEPQSVSLYLACSEDDNSVTRALAKVYSAQQFADLKQKAAELIRNPFLLDRFDAKTGLSVSSMLGEGFTTRKIDSDALSRAVAASVLVALIAGHVAYRGLLGSFSLDPGILGLSGTAAAACVLSLVSGRSWKRSEN